MNNIKVVLKKPIEEILLEVNRRYKNRIPFRHIVNINKSL